MTGPGVGAGMDPLVALIDAGRDRRPVCWPDNDPTPPAATTPAERYLIDTDPLGATDRSTAPSESPDPFEPPDAPESGGRRVKLSDGDV